MARKPSKEAPVNSTATEATVSAPPPAHEPGEREEQADDPRGELVEVVEVSDSDAERLKAALAPSPEGDAPEGGVESEAIKIEVPEAGDIAAHTPGTLSFGFDDAAHLSSDERETLITLLRKAGAPSAVVGHIESIAPETVESAELEHFEVSGRVLTVRAVRPGGRRRGGFQFGGEPVELDADDLSEDQLGQILADPELTVSFGG